MTTAIEDKELNQELLELTFIGKNWISELDILEKDIQVLRRAYVKAIARLAVVNDSEEADEVLLLFEKLYGIMDEVRTEARAYLVFITTLIDHPDTGYNLGLLENHFRIEVKLKDLLKAFNAVRKMSGKIVSASQGFR